MTEPAVLSTTWTIVWVLVGIIVSLVLPVAIRTLLAARPKGLEGADNSPPTLSQRIGAAWQQYGGNRYLKIALAATFVAIVLVLLLGLEFYKPRDAVLAGFAWESLVNKLVGGKG